MVIHFFTLHPLCKELSDSLVGKKIASIFTQQKNELLITFHAESSDPTSTLCSSIEPKSNYLLIRDEFKRAKRNSRDLFPTLLGAELRSMSAVDFDRAIHIEFDDGRMLSFTLYNTIESNIVLVGEDGVIEQSFKNDRTLHGTRFVRGQKRFDRAILTDARKFFDAIPVQPGERLLQFLRLRVPFLGKTYSEELLYRCGLDPQTPAADIGRDELEKMYREFLNMMRSIERPEPVIYSLKGEKKIFSVIPLHHLPKADAERFETINNAIVRYVGGRHREKVSEDGRNTFLEKIEEELRRAEKGLANVGSYVALAAKSEAYAAAGALIMANLQELKKGMSGAELTDPARPEIRTTVALDPALSPAGNAERYFEKAKRSKAARAESLTRAHALEERIAALRALLEALDGAEADVSPDEFVQQHIAEFRSLNLLNAVSTKEERPPFRIFSVAGGYEVWVGKNSANNDLLTMKYAKPNDLWFHVRGASGSHTILKVHGSEKPPKESIRQAASIAVYYSKMRKAGTVPVAYCERKYVRKPKGAASGSVHLEREVVIFVEPKLPEGGSE